MSHSQESSFIASKMKETEGHQWIQSAERAQDGRDAHERAKTHCEGDVFGALRLKEATSALEELHYVSEAKFPWSNFINLYKKHSDVRDKYDHECPTRTKVKEMTRMCEGCQDQSFKAQCAIIMNNHDDILDDFERAASSLGAIIADKATPAKNRKLSYRRVSSVRGGRGRGGRGRGKG